MSVRLSLDTERVYYGLLVPDFFSIRSGGCAAANCCTLFLTILIASKKSEFQKRKDKKAMLQQLDGFRKWGSSGVFDDKELMGIEL